MQTETFPPGAYRVAANVTKFFYTEKRRHSKQDALFAGLGTHFNIVSLSLNGQFFCTRCLSFEIYGKYDAHHTTRFL